MNPEEARKFCRSNDIEFMEIIITAPAGYSGLTEEQKNSVGKSVSSAACVALETAVWNLRSHDGTDEVKE